MLKDLLRRLVRPRDDAPMRAGAASATDIADRLIAQGNQAESAGDIGNACERYREAVAAAPEYGKAQLNLGIGLEASGDAQGAVAAYRRALAIDPGEPFANYNLGKLLYMQGELAECQALFQRALERKPDFPEVRVVLASLLEAQGNHQAAAAELEEALRLQPLYFGALCNYAALLRTLDRLPEAVQALRRATAIDPADAKVNYELGTALRALGRTDEAERFLRRAVEADPAFVDARATLSDVCFSQGNLSVAATELEAVLRLRPDWFDAMFNYGVVLKELHRVAEAEAIFRRIIENNPDHFPSHRLLGRVLFSQARLEEAIEVYAGARSRFPHELELESAELFMLSFSEDISDEALFARHKALGARLEQVYPARFEPFRNNTDSRRRLRVGYVSGDLYHHPVGLFLLPLIERHDRANFEVCCYSTGAIEDSITKKLSASADVWRNLAKDSETAVADRINRDEIDILVDLTGHSGVPQLRVFAQQPAPVQATWLGYLNTTGMSRVHYRISDTIADPPQAGRFHTETLIRLPNSQWCYRPLVRVEPEVDPPCRRNGYITFGSFNQISKLSLTVCTLWAEILNSLPEARLVVLGVDADLAGKRILQRFAQAGVPETRLTLIKHLPLEDYFRTFNDVDIALDTTPYSGGTTTCDTLWMAVPVLTVTGSRTMSRSAASILSTVGLTDWICSTPDEYVRKAVEWSRNQDMLVDLRKTLRGRMQESPMMDEIRFARDIEAAYRRMWDVWCAQARAPA